MYTYITFHLETDDNPDLRSPITAGMSLETFARDLEAMEQQMRSMVNEQNEDDENINNDEQLDTTEKITTEDILGNISESDTSDDDDDNDNKQLSSLIPTSQTSSDLFNESSSKSHHHKHSKKRLKTSHIPSTDQAALQLSEDEL